MIVATSFSTYIEEAGEDFEKALMLAKEDGFSAMGIMIKEPIEYYLEKKETFRSSGLRLCVHAAITDINIASSNLGIRDESIKQVKDAIFFAREVGAKIVTVHPGKFRNTLTIQEAYLFLDMALKELIEFAKANNVILCLENMEPKDKELCVSLMQVQKVLERHPDLRVTLDLAHVAMFVSSEEEMFDYFYTLKDRIAHFHISGVRPRMSHVEVSLKESDVDFSNIIREIRNFDGILRIENRERKKNIESLEFIRRATG